MRWFVNSGVLVIVSLATPLLAQTTLDYPVGQIQPYHEDSGMRPNPAVAARSVYEHLVHVEGSAWLRLYFGDVELEPGSFVRITSQLDNEIQELDADALAMWNNSTAYFNGPSVYVELVAAAKSLRNRVVIEQVASERAVHPLGGGGQCGICGADDRVAASDLWTGRLFPAGCTASVFDPNSCMVSAGHCVGGSMVVQFDVPNSQPNCNTVNPPIADQFPVTSGGFLNAGVGADWSVLIPGTNNIGQLPFERYGQLRPIAAVPASLGNPVDIWGYGVDQTCVQSQTLQTSGGSITSVGSTSYEYNVDVRGGNSGSGLIRNGEIVAIVTHCLVGCPNFGTRVDRSDFTAARANCAPAEPIVNDDCADAIPFNDGLGDGAVFFSTVGANTDGPVNPSGQCNDSGEPQTHHDIWHTYQATCTGTLTVTTCDDIHGLGDPTYDTDLVLYGPYQSVGDINCGNLIFAACNDDAVGLGCGTAPPWSSAINISVVAGDFYLIRTGGWSSGDQGSGWLSVQCAGPAAGACCAENGTCTVLTAADCATAGGAYQGDGTNCAPNPCTQATGACCLPGNFCVVATSSECSSLGGTYQGDGTSCSPDPCVPQTGACCLTDGTCLVIILDDCNLISGSYQGDGTNCSPNPCPQPTTGACCFLGGSCSEETQDDCKNAGGVYQGDGSDCATTFCRECEFNSDCDDGDPCNGLETCVGGICQPGTPPDCGDNNPCTDDFCDSVLGCVNDPNTNPCDDGDACTTGDTCSGGVCLGGPPPDCNDDDPCTLDSCDPVTGCINTPITPCCGNGVPEAGEDCENCPADVQCPPDTECVAGVCEPLTGACCFGNGSCTVETSGDCNTLGGSYQGDGSNCSPNNCPAPSADITGPLGVPDGCVDAFDLGAMLGAWCSGVNDPNPPSPPCENCTPENLAIADISGGANVPDGCVDAFDLAKLLAEWCSVAGGNPCGTCGP